MCGFSRSTTSLLLAFTGASVRQGSACVLSLDPTKLEPAQHAHQLAGRQQPLVGCRSSHQLHVSTFLAGSFDAVREPEGPTVPKADPAENLLADILARRDFAVSSGCYYTEAQVLGLLVASWLGVQPFPKSLSEPLQRAASLSSGACRTPGLWKHALCPSESASLGCQQLARSLR